MRKFWRGFRKANYIDENKVRIKAEAKKRLQELINVGGHEAENEFVEAIKVWIPDIGTEELAERIMQFHDAVRERQQRHLRFY